MDDCHIRRFERATRVKTFGRNNAADLATGNKIIELLAALHPVVGKIEEAPRTSIRSIGNSPD